MSTGRRSDKRLRRYVGLAMVLAAREFPGSYRGNATGALAAVVVPIAMLSVYSFVFSTVIPVRLESARFGPSYTLFLFSGLMVWNLFADVVIRGPRLFVGSSNYVRRPQFPVSILVVAPCVAGFYRSIPWFLAYTGAHWFVIGELSWWLLAIPPVLAVACVLTFGVALILASVGAFVRDVADFIQPIVTLLFFLSPVLYPASRIAEHADWVLLANPLAPILQAVRDLTFTHAFPEAPALMHMGVMTTGSLVVGLLIFRVARGSLADIL